MTSVAIMQPTYLPWLGYFALMDRVDIFVFLDSVQFERRSWQQRNRIKTAQGIQMLTVPVLTKGRRDQHIADVMIDVTAGFAEKHVRAIANAYAAAPHRDPYMPELIEILRKGHDHLAALNVDVIQWVAERLGIDTECISSSTLRAAGKKADYLADICDKIGASTYVSPPGSRGYLDKSDAFDRLGIPVVYNEYKHPTYPQLHGEFLDYLSVVDLLFNVGTDSLRVIRGGHA